MKPKLINGSNEGGDEIPTNFANDGAAELRTLNEIEGRLPIFQKKLVDTRHTAQEVAAEGHGRENEPISKDCAGSLMAQASLDFDVDVQQDLSTATAIQGVAETNVNFLTRSLKAMQRAYEGMPDWIDNPKVKEPVEPWEPLEVTLLTILIIISAGLFLATANNTHFALMTNWMRNVKDPLITWLAAIGIPGGAVFALEVISLADRAWPRLLNWWWRWFVLRAIVGVLCLLHYYLNMGGAVPSQAGEVPTDKLIALLIGESLMASLPISIVIHLIAKHWPKHPKLPNREKEALGKKMERTEYLLRGWCFIMDKAESIINAFAAARWTYLLRVKTAAMAEFQFQRRLLRRDYFVLILAVAMAATTACSGAKAEMARPTSIQAIYLSGGNDDDLNIERRLIADALSVDEAHSIFSVFDGARVAEIALFDGTKSESYETIREQKKQEWLDELGKKLSEKAAQEGSAAELDIPRITEHLAELRRSYPSAKITAVLVGNPFYIEGGGDFSSLMKTAIPPDSYMCDKTSPLFSSDKNKLEGVEVVFVYPPSTTFKNICHFRSARRVWVLYFSNMRAKVTGFGTDLPPLANTAREAIPIERPLSCEDKTINTCEEISVIIQKRKSVPPKTFPQRKKSPASLFPQSSRTQCTGR